MALSTWGGELEDQAADDVIFLMPGKLLSEYRVHRMVVGLSLCTV